VGRFGFYTATDPSDEQLRRYLEINKHAPVSHIDNIFVAHRKNFFENYL